MLLISNISNIEIHSEEWKRGRLAKFTSSMMFNLMGDKMLTDNGVAYIYQKVGEEMTGVPSSSEVDTPETRHGLLYEGVAIRLFGQHMGVEFLVTQKMIHVPNTRFSSTPDCIIVKDHYGDRYDVETGEIKCYPSYKHYIECALCETPEQIKAVDKKLYWQVIDQMDNCDCMRGYAVLYHPDFKAGGFRIIQFRKRELTQDFAKLKERKKLAVEKFDEIRHQLLTLKNPKPSWSQQSSR